MKTIDNINLYYDSLVVGNGSDGSDTPPCNYEISITTHFKWCNIPYSLRTITNKNDVNPLELNLYVIEPFYGDRIEEIFKNIHIDTIKFITENNLKVLVYFPIEGFDFSLHNNWMKKLHSCFKKYGLDAVKKYFIFNNIIVDYLYDNFLLSYPECQSSKFSKVFGYCFFHLEHYKILEDRWKNTLTKKQEEVNLSNIFFKEKNFLSLNAKMRPHRLFLVSELTRRNLITNSYTSFLGTDGWYFPDISLEHTRDIITSIFENDSKTTNLIPPNIKKYTIDYANNWNPLYLDSNDTELDIFKIVPKHYEETFFTIATETGMDYRLRITEKTFKPISNYHPFLVIGNEGTLKYLKELGYETFPEMFDESYDEESNAINRLTMVIDEVENFCKLDIEEKMKRFKKVYDKLLHNRNLFFNVLPDKNVKEFKEIFREIKNDN
jgi:hypothetical protein